MPTWLVVVCSLALLVLTIRLISKGQLEGDEESSNLAGWVFLGGCFLLALIIQFTS